MHNHVDENYDCPFCTVAIGGDVGNGWSNQNDVFYRNEYVTAFICANWWPNNQGHALIIPNQHIENLYDLPFETGGHILAAAREIAIAFKHVYACTGTSTRQHNEPDGYQDVFHYHMHIFPRYKNDYLYDLTHQKRFAEPQERLEYAKKLRQYFAAK